jgi:hypothetical protein
MGQIANIVIENESKYEYPADHVELAIKKSIAKIGRGLIKMKKEELDLQEKILRENYYAVPARNIVSEIVGVKDLLARIKNL